MPDRRADLYSRERIVSLESRYRHAVSRLTGAVAIIAATLLVTSIVLVKLGNDSSDQAKQLAQVVRDAQSTRALNTEVICGTVNDNVRAINALAEYIAAQVIDGVLQTKGYSPQAVAALGAKPYKVRLRQAEQIARKLRGFKHRPADCRELVRRVEGG